ncbi:PH domain-containing protein [Microbacterium sp. 1P06AB]|uniref:PH domain-containing protein n=1 Tax=Microbacterium sp. 1P06AB TaxID=3132289 RepID=UPI0039A4183E
MFVYRPTLAWRFANSAGASTFLFFGGSALAWSVAEGDVPVAALASGVIVLGFVWLVRVFRVRVIVDDAEVQLRNLFRALRIPREQITEVDQDPRTARLEWSIPGRRTRTATISAVAVGTSYLLPASTLDVPRQFLVRLDRWVRSRER